MEQPPTLKAETYEIGPQPGLMNNPGIPYNPYQGQGQGQTILLYQIDPRMPPNNYTYTQVSFPGRNLNLNRPIFRYNQQLFCPICQKNVISRITFEPGAGTWLACCALGFCIGFFGFIVFCIDDCKDCHHYCSFCGAHLGTIGVMSEN